MADPPCRSPRSRRLSHGAVETVPPSVVSDVEKSRPWAMVGARSLRSASRSRDKKPTESPIETALSSWTSSAAPPQRVVPAWRYGSLTHGSVAGSTPISMPQPSSAHRMVADNRTSSLIGDVAVPEERRRPPR